MMLTVRQVRSGQASGSRALAGHTEKGSVHAAHLILLYHLDNIVDNEICDLNALEHLI